MGFVSLFKILLACALSTNFFSILGIRNRNRALHGDLVAIDIFPESEWRINMERLRDFAMLNALNAGENEEKVDEIESLVKDVEDIELKDEKDKVVAEDDTKMDQGKVQANHARRCLIIR